MGEDAFKAGVRNYIKQHAYQNAVSDDLWRRDAAARPRTSMGWPTTSSSSRACR